MLELVFDIFQVEYEKWKRDNKSVILAVAVALLAVVMFLIGWMIAKWPKNKNTWRPW